MSTPNSQNEPPIETAYADQVNMHASVSQEGSNWAGFYQDLKQTTEFKPKEELSYRERHAVRHLRHQRDQEYNKLAFKLCDEFAQTYSVCSGANPFSSPWACRRPLQELKACVNRQLLNFRANEGEIRSLPEKPMEHVDYEQILHEFYSQPENQQPPSQ